MHGVMHVLYVYFKCTTTCTQHTQLSKCNPSSRRRVLGVHQYLILLQYWCTTTSHLNFVFVTLYSYNQYQVLILEYWSWYKSNHQSKNPSHMSTSRTTRSTKVAMQNCLVANLSRQNFDIFDQCEDRC